MSDCNVKKTFVGYDLGDGESVTDCITLTIEQAKTSIQAKYADMTMPGMKEPGRAVPTAYAFDTQNRVVFSRTIAMMPDMVHDTHANFKRRPTDLISGMTGTKEAELMTVFADAKVWPQNRADCNTPEMSAFREAVVTFTDAVFENTSFKETLRSEAADSSEIVFNVGHPTRWSALDAVIYKLILKDSVIGKGTYAGKKTSLDVAAESRAAYLTVRDKTTSNVLPRGTSALLIDVGSSTIDLTAVTANSHNYQYNSGSNYLGVRSVDYLIRELYMKKLAKRPDDYRLYEQLAARNPGMESGATLAARFAKEDLYTQDMGVTAVNLGDFAPVRITMDEVDDLLRSAAVAPAMRKHIKMPEEQLQKMGNKSWAALFEEFLREQKAAIAQDSQKIKIGRIILTGSASKMPIVPEIVKKVFSELPDGGILKDMDPSRSISKGLALVGANEEKTKAFDAEIHSLIRNVVPGIIKEDIPKLATSISPIIYKEVKAIIFQKADDWKAGRIRTLRSMSEQIRDACTETKMNALLENNASYKKAIKDWCEKDVGPDIAVKLKAICERYGVRNVSLDSLNVLKIPTIQTGPISIGGGLAQLIVNAIAAVSAIISLAALPIIVTIIATIALALEIDIIIVVAAFLVTTPVGLAFLAGLLGWGAIKIIKDGAGENIKQKLVEVLQDADIPLVCRKLLTTEKMEKEIQKSGMQSKINDAITDTKTKNDLANKITASLEAQIKKRMEDIKYVIQSE